MQDACWDSHIKGMTTSNLYDYPVLYADGIPMCVGEISARIFL